MARIPNADQAVVDLAKLRDYCLNPSHPRGRHKARLFHRVLGATQADAERLRSALLAGVAWSDSAEPLGHNGFGQQFRLRLTVHLGDRAGDVVTIWISRDTEKFPRLVTCFPV